MQDATLTSVARAIRMSFAVQPTLPPVAASNSVPMQTSPDAWSACAGAASSAAKAASESTLVACDVIILRDPPSGGLGVAVAGIAFEAGAFARRRCYASGVSVV